MIEMVSGLAAAIKASLSTQLPPPPTSSSGNFLSDLETRNHSIIQVDFNVIITESHISEKKRNCLSKVYEDSRAFTHS